MEKLSRRSFIKGSLFASLGFVLLDGFWFETSFVQWKEYNRSIGKASPVKVIQVSDLHLRSIGRIHKEIAGGINKARPDLLFITGDAIDNRRNIGLLDQFLGMIDESITKFAITGNWEHWARVNILELRALYRKYNGELLVNESRNIEIAGRSVCIIGMDDFVGGQPDFEKVKESMQPADLNIVLSHCPEYRDILDHQKHDIPLDLVLSGHTHGGQVNLLGMVLYTPKGSGKYLKGWYEERAPQMYVSKGIGTTILPFRLGARAEVSVFTL